MNMNQLLFGVFFRNRKERAIEERFEYLQEQIVTLVSAKTDRKQHCVWLEEQLNKIKKYLPSEMKSDQLCGQLEATLWCWAKDMKMDRDNDDTKNIIREALKKLEYPYKK